MPPRDDPPVSNPRDHPGITECTTEIPEVARGQVGETMIDAPRRQTSAVMTVCGRCVRCDVPEVPGTGDRPKADGWCGRRDTARLPWRRRGHTDRGTVDRSQARDDAPSMHPNPGDTGRTLARIRRCSDGLEIDYDDLLQPASSVLAPRTIMPSPIDTWPWDPFSKEYHHWAYYRQ